MGADFLGDERRRCRRETGSRGKTSPTGVVCGRTPGTVSLQVGIEPVEDGRGVNPLLRGKGGDTRAGGNTLPPLVSRFMK